TGWLGYANEPGRTVGEKYSELLTINQSFAQVLPAGLLDLARLRKSEESRTCRIGRDFDYGVCREEHLAADRRRRSDQEQLKVRNDEHVVCVDSRPDVRYHKIGIATVGSSHIAHACCYHRDPRLGRAYRT